MTEEQILDWLRTEADDAEAWGDYGQADVYRERFLAAIRLIERLQAERPEWHNTDAPFANGRMFTFTRAVSGHDLDHVSAETAADTITARFRRKFIDAWTAEREKP